MNPEDDDEAFSGANLCTRSPEIQDSSEIAAIITSPTPGEKRKGRNSGRFGQR
jgi:hypothetical protein